MSARIIGRDELLALYAMSQELPPFDIDYHASWLNQCRYLEGRISTTPDLGAEFTLVNGDADQLGRRPTIFVTIHFDLRMTEGISYLARLLRAHGRTAPLTAIVAGHADDPAYDRLAMLGEDAEQSRSHDLEYVGIDDADFSSQVMGTLRRRGSLFAALDANQGTSEVVDAPFLHHRLNIRSGLFRLAHASRAIVQPFIVDSQAGRLLLGPGLDARRAPIRRTIEDTGHFLGQHVLLQPERWLHWKHCISLNTQVHSQPGEHRPPAGAPQWYICDSLPRLGFHTGNRRLYELDESTYRELARKPSAGVNA